MAWIQIHKEVSNGEAGDWRLCFQCCTYHYDNGNIENGYRFIWRRPNGNLQAARGQARIDSPEDLEELLNLARNAGWY
jgi:hypothetical protein